MEFKLLKQIIAILEQYDDHWNIEAGTEFPHEYAFYFYCEFDNTDTVTAKFTKEHKKQLKKLGMDLNRMAFPT